MRYLVQKGNYVDVRERFAIAFWATTDLFITHGYMSMAVDNYYGAFHYYRGKIGSERNKETHVGKALLYVHPPTGRKIIALFTRVNEFKPGNRGWEDSKEQDILHALMGLKSIILKEGITGVSLHPMRGRTIASLEVLIHEVLSDVEVDVLIRHD